MKALLVALLTSTMLAPNLARAAAPAAAALPTGAALAGGQASVSQSGSAMVVTETSGRAILNWQSFNIGSAASVTFAQPNASAIVLNRVLGADPSQIDGALRANGQVILINPNGLVFGGGSTVDVGGIVASTLGIANSDFMSGDLRFSRTGSGASVVNNGAIRAASGGYVALLGSQLANRGLIQADFGSVAMAAGDRVTLTLAGRGLVGVTVDPAAVTAQIDQDGVVVASDGGVWLTAKAESALLGGAINVSGTIEANSLTAKGGTIVLEATGPISLAAANLSANGVAGGGVIKVGGLDDSSTSIGQGSVLDASATASGAGGSIETSGQSLNIGAATIRTAGAGGGAAGSWLLDPYDLTIDQTAATTIDNALATSGVTVQTSANSSSNAGVANPSGVGDIIIAAPIAWSANTVLTLDAYHGVTVNAAITAAGAGAGLVVKTDDGGAGGQLTFNAPFTLPATGSVTINSIAYTPINTVVGLQAISATGHYALVGTVNLGSTSGFAPLDAAGFTGVFEGFGNTISGLTISASTAPNVGLFGVIGVGGVVENLNLTGASVTQGAATGGTGQGGVGILVGENDGTVYNASSAGALTSGSENAGSGETPGFGGGLVGVNTGTINQSWSSATVTGSVTTSTVGNINGGLVGSNYGGLISNSFATGAVTGGPAAAGPRGTIAELGGYAGGLVGESEQNDNLGTDGIISNSYATGAVTGGSGSTGGFIGGGGDAGGLVGQNADIIIGSYATGRVTGGAETGSLQAGDAGGLVGYNSGTINDSYASGAATGGASTKSGEGGAAGGLVGYNGYEITDSYATGRVTGGKGGSVVATANGLVGDSNANALTAMTGDYWDVTTTGQTKDFYTVGVTGLTTVQWLTQGPGVAGSASGWNFASTWLQGYPYPVLRGIGYIVVSASASGTYGGTLSIDQSGVTATDQNGADALGLIDISGIGLIGGSTAAATTLTDLGGTGVTVTAPRNYQIAYAPVTAVINPAILTWSVANAGSTYGTLATAGAASLSGFVGGDTASSVAGAVGVNNGQNAVTLAYNTAAGAYNETVTGLTGAKAADYVLAGTGDTTGTLTISPLAVTLTGSKTYDGSASVGGGALTVSNLVQGDSVTLGGSATLAGKNAGAEAIASASGLTLSNSNYTVVGASGSVTINALAVTLTGSRAYDGSLGISGSDLTASNLVQGDSLTFGGSATLAAKDAGAEAITSVSGLTLSNSNYTLTGASGSVTIDPLAVTLTGSRTYDGGLGVAGGILTASNLVQGDSLTIGGSATLAAKDAGAEAIASASGLTLSNSNYTVVGASGSVTINPLAVTLTGSRTYDGSLGVAGGDLTASNLIQGDSLTFGGSATLVGKNAGAEAIASASGLTLSNSNYTLTGASGSVTIDPLAVTLTGSRTYDGSLGIAGGDLTASNLVQGDSLTFGGSATLAGKNAGPEAIASASGLTLSNSNYTLTGASGSVTIDPLAVTLTGSRTYDGSLGVAGGDLTASNLIQGDSLTFGGSATLVGKNAGPEAIDSASGLTLSNSNYTVVGASGSVTITPLAVTLTGSRTYDGSLGVAGDILTASNLVQGDSLTIGGSATLASKNAGPEAIDSTNGLTLSNANYTLAGASGSVTIDPLAITLTGSRTYDGTLGVAASNLTVTDLIQGDSLTIGGSATLAGKDAGAEAIASASGLTVSNSNYTVVGASGSVTISPLAVTLTGSRTYDGSLGIAGGDLTASNLVQGDSLTFGGSGVLAGKNAGAESITSTNGLTLSNANYTLAGAGGSVTIDPLAVTLTGTRTYDGSTSIAGAGLTVTDLVQGDSLTLGGSATLAGKDAGAEAIASANGLTLSNANYTVVGASGSVIIDPLAVTLTGSRTYDGSAAIAGGLLGASNLIAGDSLTIGGSGALAAKDVGGEAIVSTTGLTLSNANYTLAGASGSVAISPALLTITANDVDIIPGQAVPPLGVSYSGFVGGDGAGLVQGLTIMTDGTASSPPGEYGIVPGGGAAANYRIVYVDGVLIIATPNPLAGLFLTSATANSDPATSSAGAPNTDSGGSDGSGAITLLNPDGSAGATLLSCDPRREPCTAVAP
jgi:filamentous hemagglutinin family protein